MQRLPLIFLMALISGTGLAAAEPKAGAADSGPVLKILRADIAAKPSRVLIAVEDALTMNEQAACEIVKTAIESTGADATLIGEIVFTALKCAPAMAATIVECAVNTAPHAVEQIQTAIKRALGERSGLTEASKTAAPAEEAKPVTGKESAPAASGEIESSIDLSSWIGVGGIYLQTPSASRPLPCEPGTPCCNGGLTTACLRP